MSQMVNFCVAMAVSLCVLSGLQSAVEADPDSGYHPKGHLIQDSTLRQSTNLSDYIWNGAVDLIPEAWKTTFISGVANGDMNPNFYGDYILQDAIYCRIVAQLWVQLANNASVDEKVREYANNSYSGFQECSIALFDGWSVKDDRGDNYGIIAREPVTKYVTFIEDTMLASPPNMLIATYACLKLWNNLTGDLINLVNSSNPYAVWVVENHGSGSSARRQAAQMDEWDQQYQWYDWSQALSLFRAAVMNEINFFQNAGNSSAYVELHATKHSKHVESMKYYKRESILDEYSS